MKKLNSILTKTLNKVATKTESHHQQQVGDTYKPKSLSSSIKGKTVKPSTIKAATESFRRSLTPTKSNPEMGQKLRAIYNTLTDLGSSQARKIRRQLRSIGEGISTSKRIEK